MVYQTTGIYFTFKSLKPGVYLFSVLAVNILGAGVEQHIVVTATGYCNIIFVYIHTGFHIVFCMEYITVASTPDVSKTGMTVNFPHVYIQKGIVLLLYMKSTQMRYKLVNIINFKQD